MQGVDSNNYVIPTVATSVAKWSESHFANSEGKLQKYEN